jgi:hypothetical protein
MNLILNVSFEGLCVPQHLFLDLVHIDSNTFKNPDSLTYYNSHIFQSLLLFFELHHLLNE